MAPPIFSELDHQNMARALQLARLGLFTTDPNPRVGCVISADGNIIGEGFHRFAGGPHAEIDALDSVSSHSSEGATVYVTLEPCSHVGKTPPCADALIAAGIARVVVAMADPNPLVAGQGIERLRQANIQVDVGLMAADAAELNPGFIKRMSTGLPYVRVKLAGSLDGRTAMASGESNWITGEQARKDVQRWRARSTAILTGVDTVVVDDPSLNVRVDVLGDRPQPMRVILDSRLRTPPEAKLLTLDGEVVIFHLPDVDADRKAALEARGARLVEVEGRASATGQMRLDLLTVLETLGRQGVNEIHVEAGATLCGALVQAGLVDELVLYVAPHIMGDGGRGLFHLPELQKMSQRIPLRIADVRAVGVDWRIIARPENEMG